MARNCPSVGACAPTPAAARTVLCPTNQARFWLVPADSISAKYSPKLLHVGGPSHPYRCRRLSTPASDRRLTGALLTPQLPTTSVVTPCRTVLCASRLDSTVQSVWLCGSTNPGATIRPVASIR